MTRRRRLPTASRPCSADPRCYRSDGHDGEHAYPDDEPTRVKREMDAAFHRRRR